MRDRCILCGNKFVGEPVFVCHDMPATAQELLTEDNLENDHPMDLELYQCQKCGLVQFNCEPVEYYKDSTRAAERSAGLTKLRQEDYKYFIEKYNLYEKKIIEIGAGKGGYLRTLKDMKEYKIKEYGIEHNKEYVRIANEIEGVNVFCGDPEDSDLKLPGAPYDAFMSFSYLARLVKPNDMLKQVDRNLLEGGLGYIMVPSMEHLLEKNGFFDVSRDLMAYYSIDTLKLLFEKNNFDVLECGEKLDYYIYIIVKKRKKIDLKSKWSFSKNLILELQKFVFKEKKEDRKVAVWCAGHFAFTVLSTSKIGNNVSYIIDNAKFKQGYYAPGSKVPIVGVEHYKEEPVDTIIILGPIYVDEIVSEIKSKLSDKIKIVTFDKTGIRKL